MGSIITQFSTAFRDHVIAGVVSSGEHEPIKSEVRAIGPLIEAALGNASLGGMVGVIKSTRALLNADLAHDADTVAVVYGDATDANNDLYIKVGASEAGSWTLTTVLHGIVQSVLALDADITTGTSTTKAPTVKQMVDHQLAQNELIGRASWAFDWQLPSASRRGKAVRVQKDRIIADIRPHDSHYRDGYDRHYNDIVRFEFINMAQEWHGRPDGEYIWVLASVFSRFAGQWVEHINYSWNDLIGGITTNSGQVPSIFEPVFMIGEESAGYAAINGAGGSGPGHGRIHGGGLGITTTGGIRAGASIVDATNIRDIWKTLDVVEFDTLTLGQTWKYRSHDDTYDAASVTIQHAIYPTATSQLVINGIFEVAASPDTAIATGSVNMLPLRLANRVQARLRNDTLGPIITVEARDDTTTTLGDAKRVTGWHTDFAGHAMEVECPATYIQFRRDGVETAAAYVNVKDEANGGPKVRMYSHGGGGVLVDETDKQLSTYAIYNAVRADSA